MSKVIKALSDAHKAIHQHRTQGAPCAYWDDVQEQLREAIEEASADDMKIYDAIADNYHQSNYMRDLQQACHEGWRYADELEQERVRLTNLVDHCNNMLAEYEQKVAQERERCATLCLRPEGWLSDQQKQIAEEIRNAIIKGYGKNG